MSPSKAATVEQPHCRGLGNLATVSELRQLLTSNSPDVVFLSETKMLGCEFDRIQRRCDMAGSFVVDADGRRGGLKMLWGDDYDVVIQSYSLNHVDAPVKRKREEQVRFTGFYGHLELNMYHHSWDLLRTIGGRVNEG